VKSGKQRRQEMMAKRRARAKVNTIVDARLRGSMLPPGAVLANRLLHAPNNSYGCLEYYLDRRFVCRDCKAPSVWTASQQRFWYEVVRASIYTVAVRCKPCQMIERDRVREARRVSIAGMLRKHSVC
jgi:hypothetical protein